MTDVSPNALRVLSLMFLLLFATASSAKSNEPTDGGTVFQTRSTSASDKDLLNFLEFDGYFRTRFDSMWACDLHTFIPKQALGISGGTSSCPPPISYFNSDVTDNALTSRPDYLFSANMRLRVEPTINVSEDIQIYSTVDVLDNLVMGSTPVYMSGGDRPSFSNPISFLSPSQNAPLININNPYGSVVVKRLWGEVSSSLGQLTFGRFPIGFGLGLVHNSDSSVNADYTDAYDGVFFSTRVLGHTLMPGFTVSYSGPNGRGGGLGTRDGISSAFVDAEPGQRYDLDPSDNAYSVWLGFAKMDTPQDIKTMLDDGSWSLNYGLMTTYSFQINDTQFTDLATNNLAANRTRWVTRNAHLGTASLWGQFSWDHLLLETEAVGHFGQIGNGKGLWPNDPGKENPIWIIQGGVAFKSRYGLMNDRLQVGLDVGWASGDTAPGMGIRPGIANSAVAGTTDGPQFGGSDDTINNFRFNPNYRVDLILFKEVLGTVSDALYLKPHVAYFFTPQLGMRLDIIASRANYAASTPGDDNWLGIEGDLEAFFKTEDGFKLSAQYGLLVPFDGLNHNQAHITDPALYAAFGKAANAQAFQVQASIGF